MCPINFRNKYHYKTGARIIIIKLSKRVRKLNIPTLKYGTKLIEVLLIPSVLLILGVWLQGSITERQEDLAVTQLVDNYFTNFTNTSSAEESYSIAIARTRALFTRLQQLRRKDELINVLRFISEVDPVMLKGDVFEQDPQSDRYFVDLSGVELSSSNIDIIAVEGLRIWGADFDNTTFYNFECDGCGFANSTFRDAEFNDVSFVNSDLTAVDFEGSNVDSVDLDGAILDSAKWSDGRVCAKKSIGMCN